MPEKLRWVFEKKELGDLLAGESIEYLTDDDTWEEVTLVGFNTHTLSSQAFTMKGFYVEVLPHSETDFGKRWYTDNQPPLPIKVFHAGRLRAKVIAMEEPIQAIEEA
jgi:hypothetical protein